MSTFLLKLKLDAKFYRYWLKEYNTFNRLVLIEY